jgi:hypothetical protein
MRSTEKLKAPDWGRLKNNLPNRFSWRPKTCMAIRDATAILIQLRGLATELVFTVAALYGLFHAFILLTR